MFQLLGLNLFRAFATILIVWAGVKSALSAASGGPGFDFAKFADFLLVLTFGYAIFRYRLMDVDLIFKRGMAYTLAAAAVVGTYFALEIADAADAADATDAGAATEGASAG